MYVNFTIEEIRSEEGSVLKCVNLSSKLTNRAETWHLMSTDIFASSLKILRDNLNPVNRVKQIQRTLIITTVFVTKDCAVKSNLLL